MSSSGAAPDGVVDSAAAFSALAGVDIAPPYDAAPTLSPGPDRLPEGCMSPLRRSLMYLLSSALRMELCAEEKAAFEKPAVATAACGPTELTTCCIMAPRFSGSIAVRPALDPACSKLRCQLSAIDVNA